MKEVNSLKEYVKEAENIKYCYYYDEKNGVSDKTVYMYHFEWLIIQNTFLDDSPEYEFKSIEEMLKFRLEDGTCLMDYLEKYHHFPDYEIVL